ILAYNPNSNAFTYHQNNRMLFQVNFYSSEIGSAASTDLQRLVRLIHGNYRPSGCLDVESKCHHDLHLRAHRSIQLMGGISISAFGAAAISTMVKTQTPHAWTGLVIYTLSFVEL
ncbi:22744_t:CDS:2, partial [Gigaspora rosea]